MINHPLRRVGTAIVSLALAASLLAVPAAATTGSQQIRVDYTDIKVLMDEGFLVLTDVNGKTVEPFALNGTTYLPVRAVAGALGLKADWNAETKTVELTSGGEKTTAFTTEPPTGRTITMGLTADYADIKVTLDGQPLTLTDANGKTVEPFAIEGTTYLPIRAISNALGLEVGWDGEYHVVTLSTEPFVITAEDAQAFVQGILDKTYLAKYNPDYLELVMKTAEEAETDYLKNVLLEADFFCQHWGIVSPDQGESFDTLDPAIRNQVIDLIKAIYAKSSFTVGTPVAQEGTDNYTVKVTIKPIDVMDKAETAYEIVYPVFDDQYPSSVLATMTDAQYQAYCNEYAQLVIGLVKESLGTSGYLSPQDVNVRIEKNTNASFGANVDDLTSIDNLIIHYPG